MAGSDRQQDFRLGDWLVEPALNRLSGPGGRYTLEPKIMETLVVLARRPRRVVSRAELMERVWPDVVVGEEVLTRCVSELRRVLGDDPRRPRYIETIRKGGYRLLVAPRLPTAPPAGRRARWLWLLVPAAAVALSLWVLLGRTGLPPPHAPWDVLPLTAYPGDEMAPALSPDGERVAFSWGGSEGDGWDIYVRRVDGELPLRITDHPALEFGSAWSPDGGSLAFIRADTAGAAVYTVPALGGAPRRRFHAEAGIDGVDWLADGTALVAAAKTSRGAPFALYRFDLAAGTLACISRPDSTARGHWRPAVSPDGRRIAYIDLDACGGGEICIRPADADAPRRVAHGELFPRSLAWSRDGRSLVVAGVRDGRHRLFRVDLAGGGATLLPFTGDMLGMPSIARDRDRLVFQDLRIAQDIWRLRGLFDGGEPAMETVAVSTRRETMPDIAPDGRIAFCSDRGGAMEVWVSEADGARPYRVTDTGEAVVRAPRWSPDGARIAFELQRGGRREIHVVAAAGGSSRRLDPAGGLALCGWLPDGASLVVGREAADGWSLQALFVPDGTGPGTLSTLVPGACYGLADAAGRWLYYARPDQPGLWRRPLADAKAATERLSAVYPMQGNSDAWRLCERGLLLHHHRPSENRLLLLAPGAADWRLLYSSGQGVFWHLAVSADGGTVLVSMTGESDTDLMLVDGFR